MAASVELGQYGPARKYLFRKITSTPKDLQPTDVLFSFPITDTRKVATQALANAFTYYYSYTLRDTYIEWSKNISFAWTAKTDPKEVPAEYDLHQQLINEYKKEPGYVFNKPWKTSAEFSKNFLGYSTDIISIDLKYGSKYMILNDVYLGMIFYRYAATVGMNQFIDAIRYRNNRFENTPKGNKVLMLFENFCLARLNGKTYEDLARARGISKQGESFAIALLDLFAYINVLGSQSSLASEFSETVEAITGGTISSGEAENIIPYYVATWQFEVQKKVKGVSKKPGQEWQGTAVTEIAKLMGLK